MSGYRVALAIGTFFPKIGGAQVFFHNFATRLVDRGHSPVAFVNAGNWLRLGSRRDAFPYPIYPLPPRQDRWFPKSPRLFTWFQGIYLSLVHQISEFDVLHSFGAYPIAASLGPIAEANDTPHVVRVMGYGVNLDEDANYGYRLNSKVDRIVRERLPQAERVVALTPSGESPIEELGVSPEKIRVVPCAFDLGRFESLDSDRSRIRDRHGIGEDDFAFLTVARNDPIKGYEELLDAGEMLKGEGFSDFQLVLVGRGTEQLEREAEKRGILPQVNARGHIQPSEEVVPNLPPDEVLALYKACDASVFPSHMETFGNAGLEAMSAGLPLVTTEAPGCRDLVDHGKTGLKAKVGDPSDLARQMARIMEDPDLRDRLSGRARQKVEEEYTWPRVLDAYLEIYEEVCSE